MPLKILPRLPLRFFPPFLLSGAPPSLSRSFIHSLSRQSIDPHHTLAHSRKRISDMDTSGVGIVTFIADTVAFAALGRTVYLACSAWWHSTRDVLVPLRFAKVFEGDASIQVSSHCTRSLVDRVADCWCADSRKGSKMVDTVPCGGCHGVRGLQLCAISAVAVVQPARSRPHDADAVCCRMFRNWHVAVSVLTHE